LFQTLKVKQYGISQGYTAVHSRVRALQGETDLYTHLLYELKTVYWIIRYLFSLIEVFINPPYQQMQFCHPQSYNPIRVT